MTKTLARSRASLVEALTRRRVGLGFLAGFVALALATPTWTSLGAGTSIALIGEALRIWAAGHLEKSREVTQSGPYRFMRHPLYIGSSIIAIGCAIATWHPMVAAIIALYLATTIPAAIRAEEAHLRDKFGAAYDVYARGAAPVARVFSLERARYNREHHTLAGLVAVVVVLAVKVMWQAT